MSWMQIHADIEVYCPPSKFKMNKDTLINSMEIGVDHLKKDEDDCSHSLELSSDSRRTGLRASGKAFGQLSTDCTGRTLGFISTDFVQIQPRETEL